MRTLLVLIVISCCAGCGGGNDPAAAVPDPAPAESSPLALPITAPMAARDRLLNDLGQQKRQAGDRQQALDSIGGRDR